MLGFHTFIVEEDCPFTVIELKNDNITPESYISISVTDYRIPREEPTLLSYFSYLSLRSLRSVIIPNGFLCGEGFVRIRICDVNANLKENTEITVRYAIINHASLTTLPLATLDIPKS